MGARAKTGTARLGLLALIGAALALALFAAPASAKKTHLFLETFGSAAQPAFFGSNALAVDQSSGDLLVLDGGLARSPTAETKTLSRFKPNGEPDPFPALGTNVIDAKKGPGAKACGEELSSCDQTPQNGFEIRGFAGEVQIAVDNSGTITDGDIYVTQWYEGKNLVDVFAADGHYLGQLTAAGGTKFGEGKDSQGNPAPFGPCGVAVDEAGNLYLGGGLDDKIYKFKQPLTPHNPLENADGATLSTYTERICNLAAGAGPSAGALFANTHYTFKENSLFRLNATSGSLESVVDPGENRVIGVDPASGHLYAIGGVLVGTNLGQFKGKELTPSGTLVSTFNASNSSEDSPKRGIAIDGKTGLIYMSAYQDQELGEPSIEVLGPLVTVPDVSTGNYEIEGDTSVRVNGAVDPDGQALTDCFVEYETDAARKEHPFNPFTGAATKPCEAPNAAEVGSGTGPVEVHADLSLLGGETLYHYRLVAENANAALYPKDPDAIVKGSDQIFKTPSKPGIKALWTEDVVTTDATLKATLNPENSPTTYRFEYGDQGPCDANPCTRAPALPAPEPSLGSGGADHTVGFNLSGLEPATAYHYRVAATNGIGTSESADHLFTTFAVPAPGGGECENASSRTGFGALLPDCRAYELVSPVDKEGGDIRVLRDEFRQLTVLEQSSDSGEKLAYGSYRAFGAAASAPSTSQYIAQRVAGEEWRTYPINSPRGRGVVGGVSQLHSEFKAFSADLCDAWVVTYAEPPLAEGGVAGVENLYRRNDRLCGEEGYQALAPIEAPVDLPVGVDFVPELEGVSANGAEAIFSADAKLAPQGSEKGFHQLYESVGGAPLRFVCVLPDGAAWSGACGADTRAVNAEPTLHPGAISADGSRIFWNDKSSGEGELYVRENPAAPESARLHGAAAGKGTLIGAAAGAGKLTGGSEAVTNVKPEPGSAFAAGQAISDKEGFIPAKTTIVKVEETSPGVFTLTLSAKATKSKLSDALTGAASEKVLGLLTESGAFAAGQEISAAAIPPGTTVLACAPSCGPGATSLTLSAKATKTETGAALAATSPCTEAQTKACTVPVSKAAEEEAGTKASRFWGAAQSGSRAIFTTGSLTGQAKLYSFEPDGEATELLAEGVIGVMGIGANAERVYFASEKVLSEEANSEGDKAEEGQPNLYLYEAEEGGGGTTEFVARLAGADLLGAVSAESFRVRTPPRVTPDGAQAAFVSVAPLSGYDNTEVAGTACGGTEAPCREVYRYDAEANKLTCASCNPSGERPLGASTLPNFETPIHGARLLSDDGSRLYFESSDALTPHDTNGAVDVYQWEAPGAGTCAEGNSDYSVQDEGCIDLLSSGQSQLESRFVEADPTGSNVFIATASSLLPQDPGGVDIYDARANGGLPIPAGPAPGCEGEACQSPPEAPNDPTPASAAFQGAGNVVEEAPLTRTPCAKGKVRKHGKCVARHRKRAKRHQARGANRKRRAGR